MPLGELGEGVPGDDVAAHQLHRGVVVSDLLPQDGTREHRVESGMTIIELREWYSIVCHLQSDPRSISMGNSSLAVQ